MFTFRIMRRFGGHAEAPAPKYPKVFFDVSIGGQPKGRMTFEVYIYL
jgi:hypothetical protein